MKTVLLFLCTIVLQPGITHTAAIPNIISWDDPNFNITDELIKINSTCLTRQELAAVMNNTVGYFTVQYGCFSLVDELLWSIGRTELRQALHFGPERSWTHYNRTKPNEQELASASNIEAYYDMIEPISREGSLDSRFLFEKNVISAVEFMDKRQPGIRMIFRKNIRDKLKLYSEIDRKAVDELTEELIHTKTIIRPEVSRMIRNYSCHPLW